MASDTVRSIEERAFAAVRYIGCACGNEEERCGQCKHDAPFIQREFADVVETDERVRELVAAAQEFFKTAEYTGIDSEGRHDIRVDTAAHLRLRAALKPFQNAKEGI